MYFTKYETFPWKTHWKNDVSILIENNLVDITIDINKTNKISLKQKHDIFVSLIVLLN